MIYRIVFFLIIGALPLHAGGLCNGRYTVAEEILDATYGPFGTLYPGGGRAGPGHIGGLIDLYRLLADLPDLKFSEHFSNTYRQPPYHFPDEFPAYYFTWFSELDNEGKREALDFAIHTATRHSDVSLSKQTRIITRTYLNRMTLAGPPGWWLTPEATERHARSSSFPDGIRIIGDAARTEPFLDWVQYALAQSQIPSSVVWRYRPRPSHQDEMTAALRETLEEKARHYGTREWNALLSAFTGQRGQQQSQLSRVLKCTASDADYAFEMIVAYENLRRDWDPAKQWGMAPRRASETFQTLAALPEKMATHAIQNMVLLTLETANGYRDKSAARQTLADLAAHTDDARFKSWINVARSYLAASFEEILEIHRDTPIDARTFRLLNLFPVAELQQFAELVSDRPEEETIFLQAIAARQFALGNSEAAQTALDRLAEINPDITQEIQYQGPLEVRVALRLMDLDRPSVWLRSAATHHIHDFGLTLRMRTKAGYDLTLEFQTASFLNRDYASYMLQGGPSYSSTPAIFRAYRRHLDLQPPELMPFIPTGPVYGDGFPVLRLVAWDEVHRLSVCSGLSQKLSEAIIYWAREGTDTLWERYLAPREDMANALARVIRMGRHASGALVDGRPAGQVAMQLLQTRFANTDAAKTTRYWYFEDQGCR